MLFSNFHNQLPGLKCSAKFQKRVCACMYVSIQIYRCRKKEISLGPSSQPTVPM